MYEWDGIVEDTRDPLKLGRMRVRIKGVHSDNKLKVPTEDLPWAGVMNPVNTFGTFSVLLEGTHVKGYFADGAKAQMPIVTGAVPKIFLPLSPLLSGNTNWIERDRPDNAPAYGTVNSTTIGYAAVGDVANTVIAKSNKNLDHACDFRYFVDFKLDIGLGELKNPITEIQDAIKSGKNQAAKMMGLLLSQINQKLREVINALLSSLTLDVSGTTPLAFSVAKDIFREINEITKSLARYAEIASIYYNLVKDITQIVDYLKSLPDRIKGMIQACITQFLGSIQNFIDQLKAIPGIASSSLNGLLDQLGQSSQDALTNAQASNVAANSALANTTTGNSLTDIVQITLYNPTENHANTIMNFINSNFANANVTLANATSNSFDKTTMQAP